MATIRVIAHKLTITTVQRILMDRQMVTVLVADRILVKVANQVSPSPLMEKLHG